MRVYFTNLGCKLNQAEVEALTREFLAAGHRLATSLAEADLHVVNSCTVTAAAARDSRKVARRGARVRAGLRTVLTGCHATADPEAAARLAGVDLVVPNGDKDRLLEIVHRAFPEAGVTGSRLPAAAQAPGPAPCIPWGGGTLVAGRAETGSSPATRSPHGAPPVAVDGGAPEGGAATPGHTRAMVKIGDGCDMRCAFCIIPATRGRERSRPPEEVIAEVRNLTAAGFREAVLTGVQISSYRSGGWRLADLVRELLAATGLPRLRLTSIAPWELDERLIGLLAHPRVCRHVHLSLQSGSTATLRRMRRPYTAESFARLVERLRRDIPGLAVTTDVIVGFPGESEEEFAASLALVREIGFARAHVFPFSPREGTAAAGMPGQVPHPVRRRRTAAMLEAAAEGERRFHRRHLGATLEVLWEGKGAEPGSWRGLTDNYIRVTGRWPEDLGGTLRPARLVAEGEGCMAGEILP